ncbi:MAG: hypothetical protein OSB19_06905, partial [Opitutaceae bacterium]|nr:hypothetical protein [Opitutaceae bacterium]
MLVGAVSLALRGRSNAAVVKGVAEVWFTPIGFNAPKLASALKASRDASHHLQYLQDKGWYE